MTKATDFYTEFWTAFDLAAIGPRAHTASQPSVKNANPGYREFPERFGAGFRLVATASLSKDRLGAEVFTSSRAGLDFVSSSDPRLCLAVTRGGAALCRTVNGTDAKLALIFANAHLQDRAFWPIHFLWLRTALHELAETLSGPLTTFLSESAQ